MIIKKNIFLVLLIFTAINCKAGLSDTTKIFKHKLCLEIGLHHNYIFGQKYFPPDPYDHNTLLFGGHTEIFGFSQHAGFLYRIQYKFMFFETGLSYFARQRGIVCNKDSVIKYTPPMFTDYPLIIKSRTTYHNFEIPLFIGIKLMRFSISAGIRIAWLTIRSEKSTFTDNTSVKGTDVYKYQMFSERESVGIRFEYDIIKKKLPISVYAGCDYRIAELSRQFDFQLGARVYLPICNH